MNDSTSAGGHLADVSLRELADAAKSAPRGVLAEVQRRRALAAGAEAPDVVAMLGWAEGSARFELGDNDAALIALESALAAADRLPVASRIGVTLAAAEAAGGSSAAALARLDAIARTAGDPVHGALARSQQALIHLHGGDLHRCRDLLDAALPSLAAAPTEAPAVARVLLNLGYCHLLLGDLDAAKDATESAAEWAERCGEDLARAGALQNLGYIESLQGRFGPAITQLLSARDAYGEIVGVARRNLATLYDDLAETHRLAGLAQEALRFARIAVWLTREGGNAEKAADAEFRRARCLLDADHRAGARVSAERARGAYERSGRALMATRARQLLLESLAPSEGEPEHLRADAMQLSDELIEHGWVDEARMLLNRAADLVSADDVALAAELYGRVADLGETETVVGQLEQLYGQISAARLAGRPVSNGLAEARHRLRAHRSLLRDPELAAGIGRLGARFHAVEVESAVRTGDPWRVARVEDWWRSLAAPMSTPAGGSSVAVDELRQLLRTEPQDRADDHDRAIGALEQQIQLDALARSGEGDPESANADSAPALIERLDGRAMLVWVEHRGIVHACRLDPDGSGHLRPCGRAGELSNIADRLRAALADTAQLASPSKAASAAAAAAAFADALGDALFGPERTGGGRGRGPVIVSPPVDLFDLPWSLLAGGEGAPITVTPRPSALSERTPVRFDGQATFLRGPGVQAADRDWRAFARAFPAAQLLAESDGSVANWESALTDASVLHVAAHGTFRTDNPRFSTIELSDGPVLLHDLDAAPAAPDLIVLGVCNAGQISRTARGPRGVVASLLTAGAQVVVAPIVAVADQESAAAYELFYEHLGSDEPAEALARAGTEVAPTEPRLWATLHSLICCGGQAP